MTQNTISKIQVLIEPGEIFATAIASAYIELSNYKYIDFVIASGAGTAADVTVTVKGKLDISGTAATLPFKIKIGNGTSFTEIAETGDILNIGGSAGECGYAVYRITADDIAKAGYDRVNINVTAVAESTVSGSIITVLYEPRYTES